MYGYILVTYIEKGGRFMCILSSAWFFFCGLFHLNTFRNNNLSVALFKSISSFRFIKVTEVNSDHTSIENALATAGALVQNGLATPKCA